MVLSFISINASDTDVYSTKWIFSLVFFVSYLGASYFHPILIICFSCSYFRLTLNLKIPEIGKAWCTHVAINIASIILAILILFLVFLLVSYFPNFCSSNSTTCPSVVLLFFFFFFLCVVLWSQFFNEKWSIFLSSFIYLLTCVFIYLSGF